MPSAEPAKPRKLFAPFILALGLIACAGYAVWAGRTPNIGEWLWIAMFAASALIRLPHARRAAATGVKTRRVDAVEIVSLASMFAAMAVLPALTVATPLFDRFAYAPPPVSTLIGAALAVLGTILFWRSHADLGRNWSPALELREAHALVTRGVYGAIRHPMYAAIWLQALAQPLLVQNWIGGALVLPATALLYFSRTPKEERMMAAEFGAEWTGYAARTGRIIPGVRWL